MAWKDVELMPGMTVEMALQNISNMSGATDEVKRLAGICQGHPNFGPPTTCPDENAHKQMVQGAMNGAGNGDWGVVTGSLSHTNV